jgi:hypothetical protein
MIEYFIFLSDCKRMNNDNIFYKGNKVIQKIKTV